MMDERHLVCLSVIQRTIQFLTLDVVIGHLYLPILHELDGAGFSVHPAQGTGERSLLLSAAFSAIVGHLSSLHSLICYTTSLNNLSTFLR